MKTAKAGKAIPKKEEEMDEEDEPTDDPENFPDEVEDEIEEVKPQTQSIAKTNEVTIISSNMIVDLRTELFGMVKSLSIDGKKIEQAKTMVSVAQVILNACKTELEIRKFEKNKK